MKTYTAAEWAIEDTETGNPIEATMIATPDIALGTGINTTFANGVYVDSLYMQTGVIYPFKIKKQSAGISEGEVLHLW